MRKTSIPITTPPCLAPGGWTANGDTAAATKLSKTPIVPVKLVDRSLKMPRQLSSAIWRPRRLHRNLHQLLHRSVLQAPLYVICLYPMTCGACGWKFQHGPLRHCDPPHALCTALHPCRINPKSGCTAILSHILGNLGQQSCQEDRICKVTK